MRIVFAFGQGDGLNYMSLSMKKPSPFILILLGLTVLQCYCVVRAWAEDKPKSADYSPESATIYSGLNAQVHSYDIAINNRGLIVAWVFEPSSHLLKGRLPESELRSLLDKFHSRDFAQLPGEFNQPVETTEIPNEYLLFHEGQETKFIYGHDRVGSPFFNQLRKEIESLQARLEPVSESEADGVCNFIVPVHVWVSLASMGRAYEPFPTASNKKLSTLYGDLCRGKSPVGTEAPVKPMDWVKARSTQGTVESIDTKSHRFKVNNSEGRIQEFDDPPPDEWGCRRYEVYGGREVELGDFKPGEQVTIFGPVTLNGDPVWGEIGIKVQIENLEGKEGRLTAKTADGRPVAISRSTGPNYYFRGGQLEISDLKKGTFVTVVPTGCVHL
jgi:hypothetical protein